LKSRAPAIPWTLNMSQVPRVSAATLWLLTPPLRQRKSLLKTGFEDITSCFECLSSRNNLTERQMIYSRLYNYLTTKDPMRRTANTLARNFSLKRRAADRTGQVVEVLGPSNSLHIRHDPSAPRKHRDVVGVDTAVDAPKVPRKIVRFRVYCMTLKSTYSKNVQMNPPGTCTQLSSLLRKLSPPVKLVQLSETTGRVTQPLGGPLASVQTSIVGAASCIDLSVAR
jgi:hypothetical protein